MKTVSQIELKRLKKKGKVRKKMGAQPEKESPTPVIKDDGGMSGSELTPKPVSAPIPAPAPEPAASMSASMAYRDGLLEALIEQNAKTIAVFQAAITEQKPRPRVPYRHTVNRDRKTSLISEVISTPMEN